MHRKKIGIGISDFEKLITNECLFIDKSLFIKEVLDTGADILLIPRPRRFGKTLNLSFVRNTYVICPPSNKGVLRTDFIKTLYQEGPKMMLIH